MNSFKLLSNRAQVENATDAAVEAVLELVGQMAERNAITNAPKYTSRLRGSISYVVDTFNVIQKWDPSFVESNR